jgi:FkbM family methyltransferase
MSLFYENIKTIHIGNNKLILHIENKHEKMYYENYDILDSASLDAFVKKDGVIIDLGANIGYITAQILARGCKKVYAVEPVKNLFERLQLLTVQDSRLTVFNCAIGDKKSKGKIFISQEHNQGNSLNPLWMDKFSKVFGDQVNEEYVDILPLSELPINEKVDFIKVDIEGFECEFIEGAKEFFKTQKPLIQMEVYDFQLDKVIELITPYYKFYKRIVFTDDNKLLLVDNSMLEIYVESSIINPPTYLFFNTEDIENISNYIVDFETIIFQPEFPIQGNEYLIKQTDKLQFKSILDVGFGNGCASAYFSNKGKKVTALGLDINSYDINYKKLNEIGVNIIEGYFEKYNTDERYDAIWMSHVLEHTQNIGIFLTKAKKLLNNNGWLFVMVPPYKNEVVGGHLSNGWNLGQLMYNLLVSGYNIKDGHFIKYGYNLCAFVQKAKEELPRLRGDNGDIEITKKLWPLTVYQGFDGNLEKVNWLE